MTSPQDTSGRLVMRQKLIGAPATVPRERSPGSWVQTERKAHEAWARLAVDNPRASALLHTLVARMGSKNALVASQKTLAQLMGCHERTVRRAVADLVDDRWIQVVQIGSGGANAYVVNDRVAWGESREQLSLSTFSATVLAGRDEQTQLHDTPLRKIPVLFSGEKQLPTGPGEDPPSQPCIEGLEPDLPSLQAQLEARGQQRLIDPETGEIL